MSILDQINSFSYTIPFFNVTITKPVVLEYAKTHAENGGFLYALVLLILFGIIMTLIWIYIIICSLCCCKGSKNRKRKDSPLVLPNTPNTPSTPMSRSNVPLRGGGGGGGGRGGGGGNVKSSTSYEEDTETGGAIPISPLGRRTGSLERNRKRYSFACFYVTSVLFSTFLLICVGAIFVYQGKFDTSAKNLLKDVEVLMLDSADALCTKNEASQTCTPNSAGDFVQSTETNTTNLLTSLVTFLESIDDDIYPYLNSTIDDLAAAKVGLNNINAYADQINGNITVIQQYENWLVAATDGEASPLTSSLPQGDLPLITADQLSAVQDGVTAVDQAAASADDVYGTLQNFMETDVADAVAQFNTSTPPGTTTAQLREPLDQILDVLLDGRDATLKYYRVADEKGDEYAGYLTQKTWAVTIIFLLPLLLQIIFTLLNRSFSKCSGHLVVGMCCQYLCLLFFLLLGMVFALLAAVSGSVCEYHLQAIEKIPVQNLTVNDIQLSITPAVIDDILNCPAGPTATLDNNFVNLLNAEGVFNISSQTDEAIAQIESARTSFSPQTQIQESIDQLAALGESATLNVTEGNNITTYRGQVVDLLADLPPVAMDRDDAASRASLAEYYLTDPAFSWDRYQGNITLLNGILAQADTIPPDFLRAYTFQTMWNFTRDTVEDEPAWQTSFAAPAGYNALLARLDLTDPYTIPVNEAVAMNDEVRANLTAVLGALDAIEVAVGEIDATQQTLSFLQQHINTSLYYLLDDSKYMMDELAFQEEKIRALSTFVSTAPPEYTKCGFVGEFYEQGFQEGFCQDMHSSLAIMWPFMLAAAVFLFGSFVTFSCFIRKPRWYTDPDYDQMQDRNNLTPGRTPRGAALVLA